MSAPPLGWDSSSGGSSGHSAEAQLRHARQLAQHSRAHLAGTIDFSRMHTNNTGRVQQRDQFGSQWSGADDPAAALAADTLTLPASAMVAENHSATQSALVVEADPLVEFERMGRLLVSHASAVHDSAAPVAFRTPRAAPAAAHTHGPSHHRCRSSSQGCNAAGVPFFSPPSSFCAAPASASAMESPDWAATMHPSVSPSPLPSSSPLFSPTPRRTEESIVATVAISSPAAAASSWGGLSAAASAAPSTPVATVSSSGMSAAAVMAAQRMQHLQRQAQAATAASAAAAAAAAQAQSAVAARPFVPASQSASPALAAFSTPQSSRSSQWRESIAGGHVAIPYGYHSPVVAPTPGSSRSQFPSAAAASPVAPGTSSMHGGAATPLRAHHTPTHARTHTHGSPAPFRSFGPGTPVAAPAAAVATASPAPFARHVRSHTMALAPSPTATGVSPSFPATPVTPLSFNSYGKAHMHAAALASVALRAPAAAPAPTAATVATASVVVPVAQQQAVTPAPTAQVSPAAIASALSVPDGSVSDGAAVAPALSARTRHSRPCSTSHSPERMAIEREYEEHQRARESLHSTAEPAETAEPSPAAGLEAETASAAPTASSTATPADASPVPCAADSTPPVDLTNAALRRERIRLIRAREGLKGLATLDAEADAVLLAAATAAPVAVATVPARPASPVVVPRVEEMRAFLFSQDRRPVAEPLRQQQGEGRHSRESSAGNHPVAAAATAAVAVTVPLTPQTVHAPTASSPAAPLQPTASFSLPATAVPFTPTLDAVATSASPPRALSSAVPAAAPVLSPTPGAESASPAFGSAFLSRARMGVVGGGGGAGVVAISASSPLATRIAHSIEETVHSSATMTMLQRGQQNAHSHSRAFASFATPLSRSPSRTTSSTPLRQFGWANDGDNDAPSALTSPTTPSLRSTAPARLLHFDSVADAALAAGAGSPSPGARSLSTGFGRTRSSNGSAHFSPAPLLIPASTPSRFDNGARGDGDGADNGDDNGDGSGAEAVAAEAERHPHPQSAHVSRHLVHLKSKQQAAPRTPVRSRSRSRSRSAQGHRRVATSSSTTQTSPVPSPRAGEEDPVEGEQVDGKHAAEQGRFTGPSGSESGEHVGAAGPLRLAQDTPASAGTATTAPLGVAATPLPVSVSAFAVPAAATVLSEENIGAGTTAAAVAAAPMAAPKPQREPEPKPQPEPEVERPLRRSTPIDPAMEKLLLSNALGGVFAEAEAARSKLLADRRASQRRADESLQQLLAQRAAERAAMAEAAEAAEAEAAAAAAAATAAATCEAHNHAAVQAQPRQQVQEQVQAHAKPAVEVGSGVFAVAAVPAAATTFLHSPVAPPKDETAATKTPTPLATTTTIASKVVAAAIDAPMLRPMLLEASPLDTDPRTGAGATFAPGSTPMPTPAPVATTTTTGASHSPEVEAPKLQVLLVERSDSDSAASTPPSDSDTAFSTCSAFSAASTTASPTPSQAQTPSTTSQSLADRTAAAATAASATGGAVAGAHSPRVGEQRSTHSFVEKNRQSAGENRKGNGGAGSIIVDETVAAPVVAVVGAVVVADTHEQIEPQALTQKTDRHDVGPDLSKAELEPRAPLSLYARRTSSSTDTVPGSIECSEGRSHDSQPNDRAHVGPAAGAGAGAGGVGADGPVLPQSAEASSPRSLERACSVSSGASISSAASVSSSSSSSSSLEEGSSEGDASVPTEPPSLLATNDTSAAVKERTMDGQGVSTSEEASFPPTATGSSSRTAAAGSSSRCPSATNTSVEADDATVAPGVVSTSAMSEAPVAAHHPRAADFASADADAVAIVEPAVAAAPSASDEPAAAEGDAAQLSQSPSSRVTPISPRLQQQQEQTDDAAAGETPSPSPPVQAEAPPPQVCVTPTSVDANGAADPGEDQGDSAVVAASPLRSTSPAARNSAGLSSPLAVLLSPVTPLRPSPFRRDRDPPATAPAATSGSSFLSVWEATATPTLTPSLTPCLTPIGSRSSTPSHQVHRRFPSVDALQLLHHRRNGSAGSRGCFSPSMHAMMHVRMVQIQAEMDVDERAEAEAEAAEAEEAGAAGAAGAMRLGAHAHGFVSSDPGAHARLRQERRSEQAAKRQTQLAELERIRRNLGLSPFSPGAAPSASNLVIGAPAPPTILAPPVAALASAVPRTLSSAALSSSASAAAVVTAHEPPAASEAPADTDLEAVAVAVAEPKAHAHPAAADSPPADAPDTLETALPHSSLPADGASMPYSTRSTSTPSPPQSPQAQQRPAPQTVSDEMCV